MGIESHKSFSSEPSDPSSKSADHFQPLNEDFKDSEAPDGKYVKSQARIDRINRNVVLAKKEGDEEALAELLKMFEPLVQKIARHYHKQYGDLIPFDTLLQETRQQFCDLTLNSHTIGGPASFTVFINNFLFRRMQKWVANEKRYHLTHDRMEYAEVARPELDLTNPEPEPDEDEAIKVRQALFADILEAIYADKLLDEIELRVFELATLYNMKDQDVADALHMSRPYVSRLHKRALVKIRDRFGDRWRAINDP
jgi:RNA polymerase sigma factor (sigma-70 family)